MPVERCVSATTEPENIFISSSDDVIAAYPKVRYLASVVAKTRKPAREMGYQPPVLACRCQRLLRASSMLCP